MKKILIVEDNQDDRRLLRYNLEKRGFFIFEAKDGVAALETIEKNRPDLIISDALMPNMDGFQLLKRIKADPDLQTIPFVFYSCVYTGHDEQELALSLGAASFLVKPLDPGECWRQIEAVISKLENHTSRKQVSQENVDEVFLEKYAAITATKLEEKVREVEGIKDKWQKTFDAISDIITVQDSELRILQANKAATDFFEIKQEDIKSFSCYQLFSGKDEICPVCPLQETIKDKKNHTAIIEHKSLNKTFLVSSSAILDDRNELEYLVHVAKDITQSQKVEKERKLNEERFQSLLLLHEKRTLQEKDLLDYALEEAVRLTNSQCGYLHFVDDDQIHISLNSWSKETLKLCTAEKAPHYPLDSAGIWADCVRLRKPVIHNDYPNYPEKKGYPEGHFPVLRHMSVPIFDGSKIVAIIGVGNKEDPYNDSDQRQLNLFFASTWDIIKQIRFQEEKVRMGQQLQQAQKMEAIGTLAGGIAHDFNNLLSIILGYTQLAQEDAPDGSEYKTDLDNVFKAGNRAKELVKQILMFSRQTSADKVPIELQPIIKEAAKMLRASIPTTIEINVQINETCGIVFADPTQVHQIIMNLCTNANHAMEESGGILNIELKDTLLDPKNINGALNLLAGEYVELIISDTGKGIGPDIIDKIFDPYFTTKEPGKGTGMGLAIIHGIVNENGGTVTVESKLGKGTEFHVFLPVFKQQDKIVPGHFDEILYGNERILFIDDEKVLAEMGKHLLERLGYKVTTILNSQEALTTFQKNPADFDAIVTDQTMPGMTGAELSRHLLKVRPDIPIILCTGYSNLIDEKTAKSIGIKEFVLKPLVRNDFAQLLRKVLDDS